MQLDMHYYATYAMARAAGIEPEDARIIATSAQFVDDNIAQSHVEFRDGSRIDQEATAHHPINLSNLDDRDQRRVWVPFHFIPGNVGDGYTERLKCRIDSPIVRELRDHHLTFADRGFALHLLGITAHVYADTFSHYGFSGVSSRGNKVDNSSFRFHEEVEEADDTTAPLSPEMRRYVTGKADRFFKGRGDHGGLLTNVKSWFAEELSGALGHGSVATLPDRPYLVWTFDYERPDAVASGRSTRNNPVTYLAGCRALHDMFRRFAAMRADARGGGNGRDFDAIARRVRDVLLVQADKDGRIATWQDAARSGEIFGAGDEDIPEYDGRGWNEQWDQLDGAADYQAAGSLPVWQFYRAAALHRTYVLRDLLPKYGLVVD